VHPRLIVNFCIASRWSLAEGRAEGAELTKYQADMEASWVWPELRSVRNYHPSFQWGLIPGMIYSGVSAFITKGREPWTLRHSTPDSGMTKPAVGFSPINYPKPDGVLSFDLLTNLARSGTSHEADQPSHLRIKVRELDCFASSSVFDPLSAPILYNAAWNGASSV
jgi:hypothetical protein